MGTSDLFSLVFASSILLRIGFTSKTPAKCPVLPDDIVSHTYYNLPYHAKQHWQQDGLQSSCDGGKSVEQKKPLVETKGNSSNYYTTCCSLGSNSITNSLHLSQKCALLSTIFLNSSYPKHLTLPLNICSSV